VFNFKLYTWINSAEPQSILTNILSTLFTNLSTHRASHCKTTNRDPAIQTPPSVRTTD